MEDNTGDIQLNIEVPSIGSHVTKSKKSAFNRKQEWERKRERKNKRFQPKAKKEVPKTENKATFNFKKKKERPKPEEPAFAKSILRGEVLPTINQAEGKYVFHKLKELLGTKHPIQSKVIDAHQNKKTIIKDLDLNISSKSEETNVNKDANNASGGEFASFIKKNRKFSHNLPNTNTDVRPTGKFFRKAKSSSGGEVQNKMSDKPNVLTNFVKKSKLKEVTTMKVREVSSSGDNVTSLPSEPDESLPHGSLDRHENKRKQVESEDISYEAFNQSDHGHKRKKTLDDQDSDGDFRIRKKTKEGDDDHSFKGKFTSLFVNNPEIPQVARRAVRPVQEPVFSNETFADLNIHKFQVSNLASLDLTRLMTVQRKAIPPLLEGRDALVRSQTGSGKTLAYALPLVELLQRHQPPLTRADGIRALVVLPTRELALQTYEWFLKLVKPFMRLVPGCLVGGEKRKSEKARLRKGVTILVGTPGRILDHVQHTRAVRLNRVQYFVLDEADCMLDMGYERDIASIVHALETQTGPLLPKSALEWNRKTYGRNDVSAEYNKTSSNDKRKPQKIIFNSDDEAQNDSSEESSGNNVKASKETGKSKELPTTLSVHNSEDHEGNSSDYDAEILAEEVIPMKGLMGEEKDTSEESDDESDEDDSESEEGGIRKKPDAPSNVVEMQEEGEAAATERPKKEPGRWQTVLLSATLTPAVERLAGLALRSPAFVDAADVAAETADVVIPDSITQKYIVVPAKLRLVTLSAFIVWKCKFTDERKILLFCATMDTVNYLTELLTLGLGKGEDDDEGSDDEDSLNLNIEFFRLHGDMEQKERTHVFQTFRTAECGVLLSTDLAARGLDLPSVDWIVQYSGPGSVADYVHRVGRTARGGAAGNALLFLLPMEVDFVEMLQDRRIRLREERMDKCLEKLALASSSQSVHQKSSKSVESAATSLQLRYENAVLDRRSLHDLAVKAYVSFARFYATYPREMREVFCFKSLHLGHVAKSFALRDPPSSIGGIGRRRFQSAAQEQPEKRLNMKLQLKLQDIAGHPVASGTKRPKGWSQRGKGKGKRGFFGKPERKHTRDLILSEFASGLEPARKKQKRRDAA